MKLKEFVRNPQNYDVDEATLETALKCDDKSLAQQQFKEESDINFIADRFGLNGEVPQLTQGFTWGAEYTEVFDYQSAQNAIVAGDRAFMALPAKLRARFQNDPQQLMDFLEDRDNDHEAIKLGLKIAPPAAPTSPTINPGEPTTRKAGDNPAPPERPSSGSPTTPSKG